MPGAPERGMARWRHRWAARCGCVATFGGVGPQPIDPSTSIAAKVGTMCSSQFSVQCAGSLAAVWADAALWVR